MTPTPSSLACLALLCSMASLPAAAASSAASSASDSITTSMGSVSGSIERSSTSSTTTTAAIEGDYRIVEVATVAERPGTLRLRLQALPERGADRDAGTEFFLYLPQAAADQGRLAADVIVTARQRPYGTEFTHGQTRQAFFLVLSDDWYQELRANVVVL